MYMQCKEGFVEVDAWDGQKLPLPAHHRLILAVKRRSDLGKVVVVRSREESTIRDLLRNHGVRAKVLASPPGWDYEFRTYLPIEAWAHILEGVALGLDYRNFKSWTGANTPGRRARLAHDVWHVAHDAFQPVKKPTPPGLDPSLDPSFWLTE